MHRTPKIRVAAAVIGLTLFAAACSDDTDAADEATTTTALATETTASGDDDTTADDDGTTTTAAMAEMDIVETAVAAGDFTTLATALEAADLVETLQGPGPFTVFAPTDEAFEGLPAGTLDSLVADQAALTNVLTYHVVDGAVMAADVVELTEATALNGDPITIAVDGDTVTLNGTVQVTMTDIEASNGVIHVIDGVLLPPS